MLRCVLIKTLVLTCLFALPTIAQDNEKTSEGKADQAQQVEETKKAKEIEKVYAFLDEHFPEMTGKLVHVFCSATWCAPCQVMVKKVFPKEEVQEALKEFEPLYLDGDVFGIFARKYHVRAFPTSIIINAEGEFLHRSNANGMSAEEFIEWLKVKK